MEDRIEEWERKVGVNQVAILWAYYYFPPDYNIVNKLENPFWSRVVRVERCLPSRY